MTDEEKQLLKAGTEAAFKPFASLIERFFGGAVDQIGGMWEDRLKVRREVRKLQLMKKLKAHIEEFGFEPQPIPDKIWLPALQAALNEDHPTLQGMWADLLANAANPDADEVPPAFPEMLRQLSAGDALFFREVTRSSPYKSVRAKEDFIESGALYGIWQRARGEECADSESLDDGGWVDRRRALLKPFRVSVDNLVRLGLIEKSTVLDIPIPNGLAASDERLLPQKIGHSTEAFYTTSALVRHS